MGSTSESGVGRLRKLKAERVKSGVTRKVRGRASQEWGDSGSWKRSESGVKRLGKMEVERTESRATREVRGRASWERGDSEN